MTTVVKPLAWEPTLESDDFAGGLYSRASSGIGDYEVWGSGLWRGPFGGNSRHQGNIVTAMASAQADFETRVRSCLVEGQPNG